jgi:dTDP-4-dehydrorhamnose 3,5-epimerase
MSFRDAEIEGVIVRPLKKFSDERGWLSELFRSDELDDEFFPAMSYISVTNPGVQRGPHEHVDQADYFCFIAGGTFRMGLWDNRSDSPTYMNRMIFDVGEENPATVLVPKGVVHTYKNISAVPGVVINCPNRLFMGENRASEIDEIRHENDPDTPYRMDG